MYSLTFGAPYCTVQLMLLTLRKANGLISEALHLIKTVLENFKDKIFLC